MRCKSEWQFRLEHVRERSPSSRLSVGDVKNLQSVVENKLGHRTVQPVEAKDREGASAQHLSRERDRLVADSRASSRCAQEAATMRLALLASEPDDDFTFRNGARDDGEVVVVGGGLRLWCAYL